MLFIKRVDKPTKNPELNIIKEVLEPIAVSKTIEKALQLNLDPAVLITSLKRPCPAKTIIAIKRLSPLISDLKPAPDLILPKPNPISLMLSSLKTKKHLTPTNLIQQDVSIE
jgi:hypothetical protein